MIRSVISSTVVLAAATVGLAQTTVPGVGGNGQNQANQVQPQQGQPASERSDQFDPQRVREAQQRLDEKVREKRESGELAVGTTQPATMPAGQQTMSQDPQQLQAMVQRLEAENRQLRQQVEQLRQQLAAGNRREGQLDRRNLNDRRDARPAGERQLPVTPQQSPNPDGQGAFRSTPPTNAPGVAPANEPPQGSAPNAPGADNVDRSRAPNTTR